VNKLFNSIEPLLTTNHDQIYSFFTKQLRDKRFNMAVTNRGRAGLVGLVGLNCPYSGTPTGTNWAAFAHLPYLKASSKFELVALQNSTAKRA
jgi:hypothetical protein